MKNKFDNKKIRKNSLFVTLVLFFTILSTLLFSLGTQSLTMVIAPVLENYVVQSNETAYFTAKVETKTFGSFVKEDVLTKLLNQYYSSALAARFINENVFIEATDGENTYRYPISLLESNAKSKDADFMVVQGLLKSIAGESYKLGDYPSKYSFLSTSDDAIYLPQNIADNILIDFGFVSYEDFLYSEKEDSSYLGKLGFQIVSTINDDFYLPIKARGVYSTEDYIGKTFDEFSGTNPISICSPQIINNLSFLQDELLIIIKPSRNLAGSLPNFIDMLDSSLNDRNLVYDFTYINNNDVKLKLTQISTDFKNQFYVKNYLLFIISGSLISLIFLVVYIYLYKKEVVGIIYLLLTPPISLLLISLLGRIPKTNLIFPTKMGIYILSGINLLIIITLLPKVLEVLGNRNKDKQYKKYTEITI